MATRENAFLALARIPIVRRMWAAITFSSFGDWLGLLATTAMAQQLTDSQSRLTQGAAVGGVLLVRLSPDLFFGPFAAAFADKWDRRKTVIVGDTLAGLLYASIALGYSLVWLYVVQFVIEAVNLFTQPAKQVIQTTIVPKRLLATANQVSLFSVYGSVPIAAGVFALLSAGNRLAAHDIGDPVRAAVTIALLLDTVSYFGSSGTVYLSRRLIPVMPASRERAQGVWTLLREGVGFVRGQPLIKSLYFGIIGAFAGGGLTVGVALLWVKTTLSAGAAGYSVMFGTVFTGLAIGILLGPKVLPRYSRSRVFALAITSAGVTLLVMSLIRDFVLADIFAALVGLFAGMAWIIGYTLIGQEVAERLRGRVFAFVLSSVRLTLLATIAVGPILAGAIGSHTIAISGHTRLRFSGPGLTLLLGGIVALAVGWYALARATPTRTRMRDLLRRRVLGSGRRPVADHSGVLIAVDGLDPAATESWSDELTRALRGLGATVCRTGTHAGSPLGRQLRELRELYELRPLEPETAVLLAAAERSDQVTTVIRPALERDEVVVCDRWLLTTMAVHGGEHGADVEGIRDVDQWGTAGLRADLTVVVDDPVRTEGASAVLHEEADADPDRHVVVAAEPVSTDEQLLARLRKLLETRGTALTEPAAGSEPAADALAAPIADVVGAESDVQPLDVQPLDGQLPDAQPPDGQPLDGQPSEAPPSDRPATGPDGRAGGTVAIEL